MKKHPQAVATGTIGLAAAAVTWIFHKVGVTVESYYAVAIAGAATAALTWVGREGLVGLWNGILHGFGRRTP